MKAPAGAAAKPGGRGGPRLPCALAGCGHLGLHVGLHGDVEAHVEREGAADRVGMGRCAAAPNRQRDRRAPAGGAEPRRAGQRPQRGVADEVAARVEAGAGRRQLGCIATGGGPGRGGPARRRMGERDGGHGRRHGRRKAIPVPSARVGSRACRRAAGRYPSRSRYAPKDAWPAAAPAPLRAQPAHAASHAATNAACHRACGRLCRDCPRDAAHDAAHDAAPMKHRCRSGGCTGGLGHTRGTPRA